MNKIKMYLKVLIVPTLCFLFFPLFISIFNLFGLELNKIVLIIISSLIFIVTGFLIGIHSEKKGFINGLIVGLIFILFLLLLSFMFSLKFRFVSLIYYLILLVCSILGSIFGINKKNTD